MNEARQQTGDGMDAEKWFREAVERHRDMVFRLAYTYLRDPADADDVTQDVFVKLCSAAASGLRAMSI